MKIVILGLGSIGRRHYQAIKTLTPEAQIYRLAREGSEPSIKGINDRRLWAEIEALRPDFAVIASPTPFHVGQALDCTQRGIPFFLEKPISVGLDGLDNLIKQVGLVKLPTYVAYPFRHHRLIRSLKSKYEKSHDLIARVICHTDASKWPSSRPLDHILSELSHELDYSQAIFGDIQTIEGWSSDRFASLVLKHDRGNETWASLSLVSQDERREIWVRNKGVIDKHSLVKSDEMYVEQLKYFMTNLKNSGMENNLLDASRLFRKVIEFKEGKT